MWVGTFHGLSARILRMYSSALGLQQNILILDGSILNPSTIFLGSLI